MPDIKSIYSKHTSWLLGTYTTLYAAPGLGTQLSRVFNYDTQAVTSFAVNAVSIVSQSLSSNPNPASGALKTYSTILSTVSSMLSSINKK